MSVIQAGLRPARYLTLQEQYEEWLDSSDGQAVYAACRGAARRLTARGFSHYGIAALYEAARYDHMLRVGPDKDGWKLNNNWRSRLARTLMEQNTDLVGFFELRELRA